MRRPPFPTYSMNKNRQDTTSMSHDLPHDLPLGKKVAYDFTYNPELLHPVPRRLGREAAGLLSFAGSRQGVDIWNIYELSWLSPSGLPAIAIAELRVPADSPSLIESKSLKLYCNSFNMSRFESSEEVRTTMEQDLGRAAGARVKVHLIEPAAFVDLRLAEPEGICLDGLPAAKFAYRPESSVLAVGRETVRQTLFSRLFRSCCPVTGQPDYATVTVSYAGRRIVPETLLRYLVSYREHSGFHETCVEMIFRDLLERTRPEQLTVSARFTRRGGIDINPVRSTLTGVWPNPRDPRQ